jgi:signal transduction histidine kinase
MVFCTRTVMTPALNELPGMEVGGLPDLDARQLLAGQLSADAITRAVAETGGNPLALLELGTAFAGKPLPPAPLPLGPRLETLFLRRARALPAPTQEFLLLVALAPPGDPLALWQAAERLGLPDDASDAGLETQRMGRLVDDMLRLARLGQHPGQGRELVDLTALVTGCADRVRTTDPGRRWQVDVAVGLEMTGDEELLRRAVDNLCANVLVHTPRDTAAIIAATAGDGQVRIEVSDDGPGVAAGRLSHIFERFYRAGAGASRPGSGLGLAIVAEVAAAHGGTAEAAPASPHGLRITLTLPLDRPAPSPQPEPRHSTAAAPASAARAAAQDW